MEKQIPQMFFYIDCAHQYKEALAKFEDDRAYFVGIKEIVFQRSDHTAKNDTNMYSYGSGEGSLNIEHNDFNLIGNSWKMQ